MQANALAQGAQRKLVCVVGTDDFHQEMIGRIPEAEAWQVEPVLHRTEVQPRRRTFDFDALYDRARHIIDGLDRPPDAIVGHLDFPVTVLVSLLCRDYGLPGPTPEAVARCEHKHWMRQCQRDVMPDDTPRSTGPSSCPGRRPLGISRADQAGRILPCYRGRRRQALQLGSCAAELEACELRSRRTALGHTAARGAARYAAVSDCNYVT